SPIRNSSAEVEVGEAAKHLRSPFVGAGAFPPPAENRSGGRRGAGRASAGRLNCRQRVAPRGERVECFLPVLRGTGHRCQRLRRVPFRICLLGRRAFLRVQTTTEHLSSASITATTTAIRETCAARESCSRGAVIAGQCSAAPPSLTNLRA